jgi:hypothetical protein
VIAPTSTNNRFVFTFKDMQTSAEIRRRRLGGTAPIAVRSFFGNELGILGTVHVGAVLVASTGFGYLLADFGRARQLTDRHTG